MTSVAVCVPFRARSATEDRILAFTAERWRADLGWPVLVADATPGRPFERSASRNAAAAAAGDVEVLVFANADTLYEDPAAVVEAVEVAAGCGWVLSRVYREADEAWTAGVLDAGDWPVALPPERTLRRLEHSPAGFAVVAREAHVAVGGFDEGYGAGWGWEDTAYADALTARLGVCARVGDVIHLWHPRRPEDHPGHPTARVNRSRWRAARARLDAEARRVRSRAGRTGRRAR